MKKRFYVVDYYEGYEVIGTTDDREEADRMAGDRIADTDGECALEIIDTMKEV